MPYASCWLPDLAGLRSQLLDREGTMAHPIIAGALALALGLGGATAASADALSSVIKLSIQVGGKVIHRAGPRIARIAVKRITTATPLTEAKIYAIVTRAMADKAALKATPNSVAKFEAFSGKLSVNSSFHFGRLEIRVGDVNLYKVGGGMIAAAGAATQATCEGTSCILKKALRSALESKLGVPLTQRTDMNHYLSRSLTEPLPSEYRAG